MMRRGWVLAVGASIVVVGLFTAAFKFVAGRLAARPTVVRLHIDPDLHGDGAWTQSQFTNGRWSASDGPTVNVVALDQGAFSIMVAQVGSPKTQRLELEIALERGDTAASVGIRWYGDDEAMMYGPYEHATDLTGVVTVDADRAPTPGDDRILAYDLRAMRDDQPVELRGKVRIPYVAGPR